MKNLKTLFSAAGLATLLGAGSAFAAFPASVVSPNWQLRANNTINITVDIKTQGTVGGCPTITGNFVDGLGTTGISGWYCPSTGQISFLRTNTRTGVTGQVYIGQVITLSTDPVVLEMEGNFIAVGGTNGSYPFAGNNAVITPPPIQ